jgi:hypothetical protein
LSPAILKENGAQSESDHSSTTKPCAEETQHLSTCEQKAPEQIDYINSDLKILIENLKLMLKREKQGYIKRRKS